MKLLTPTIGLILVYILVLGEGSVIGKKDVARNLQTIVATEKGLVEGFIERSKRKTSYVSFKGIPFAKPPLGPLRFKDPIPVEPWSGILKATQQRDQCVQPQNLNNKVVGTEDCLYLNVYTPDVGTKSLPVFLYIHGGGFESGDSAENPESIVDEDFVVVMITYRVGVFGYLSLNTEDVPGNAGMKDQIAALKWVQKNIRSFGGNPNNVTIFGLSAGGASTSLLHVSPMAKGLFQKVIATSGACLCGFSLQTKPTEITRKLAHNLNLTIDDITIFTERLRNIPAYEITSAGVDVEADRGSKYEDLKFTPVVETSFQGVEPFLLKSPEEYIVSGEFNDVPAMYGYMSKEYLGFYNLDREQVPTYIADDYTVVPDRLRFIATEKEVVEMAKLVREFYIKAQVFKEDNDMVNGAIGILGDIMLSQPIIRTAAIFGRYSKSPVFHYRFSYRGKLADNNLGVQGAGHGADIRYLYIKEDFDVDDYSSEGWVRRRIIRLFKNFAHTGNPTPGEPDTLIPIKWEPVTAQVHNYLEMNGDLTPSTDPDRHRTQFWKELEEKLKSGELQNL